MIPAYFGRCNYYEYSQLKRFKKEYPKRCAKKTQNGFLCEYYTAPRLITNRPLAGYTPYTKYQIYDVNEKNDLVRVSVRIPRYINNDGQICEEPFGITPGKYTHAALNKLHFEFCDPTVTFELLKKHFPLNKNASKDAYEILYPWARSCDAFPKYPIIYSHLWFIDIPYKKSMLTFCFSCHTNEEPSLFDIIIDNNWDNLDAFIQYIMPSQVCICIAANSALYKKLHNIFPDGIFVFDPIQIINVLECCISADTGHDKQTLKTLRHNVLNCLKHVYFDSPQYKNDIDFLLSVINHLLSYQHSESSGLIQFQNNMKWLMQKETNFISDYFCIPEFRSFLPYQLKEAIKEYYKNRGYEPARFSYILLSSIRNLPYIDPAAVHSTVPALMTDEELKEMRDKVYEAKCNAELSSINNVIKQLTDGTYTPPIQFL